MRRILPGPWPAPALCVHACKSQSIHMPRSMQCWLKSHDPCTYCYKAAETPQNMGLPGGVLMPLLHCSVSLKRSRRGSSCAKAPRRPLGAQLPPARHLGSPPAGGLQCTAIAHSVSAAVSPSCALLTTAAQYASNQCAVAHRVVQKSHPFLTWLAWLHATVVRSGCAHACHLCHPHRTSC